MLTGIFLVALGALALATGLGTVRHRARSSEWPSVRGRLVAARPARSGQRFSGPGLTFEVQVEFAYTVDGQEHLGRTLYSRSGGGAFDEQDAAELVRQLPPDPLVHYNPSQPGESFLLQSPIKSAVAAIVVGLLFVLAGLGTLVAAARPETPRGT